MVKITSRSPVETQQRAAALWPHLKPGDVVLFVAQLGAGKTTFIQGLIEAAGVKDHAMSPTFILAQTFLGRRGGKKIPIHHLDFYRLSKPEIWNMGIQDYLMGEGAIDKGIVLIEWADRFPELWPVERLEVYMDIKPGSTERVIQFKSVGERFKDVIKKIKKS